MPCAGALVWDAPMKPTIFDGNSQCYPHSWSRTGAASATENRPCHPYAEAHVPLKITAKAAWTLPGQANPLLSEAGMTHKQNFELARKDFREHSLPHVRENFRSVRRSVVVSR